MTIDKCQPRQVPPVMAVNHSRVQLWMPSAVQALASRPDGRIMAVGRKDGDIELTVPGEGYRAEARVPGQKDKGLRSLTWINGSTEAEAPRLFGCGLDGTVFEVDLVRLCYKNVRDVYGGSAWTMRSSGTLGLLAVGCEDGSVRLFSTEGDGVEYKRSFPPTGSRVLSLAWGPENLVIYAGGADSMIHCLDAKTGQGLFDMRLERSSKGEALVWAIEALDDGTVISGDSSGCVQVWDGQTGTQLQSLVTHEADVLCLCVSPKQTEVFASGCDGKVVCLERREEYHSVLGPDDDGVADVDVDVDAEEDAMKPSPRRRQGWEWSLGSMHREHTHDVHAMSIHQQSLGGNVEDGGVGAARKGPILVSGGVDASLTLYSVPGFKTYGPRALEPLPPIPSVFLARAPRCVLVMHNLRLDVWEIPRHSRSFAAGLGDSEEDGALLDDGGGNRGGGQSPSVRLSLVPMSEKGGHLACAAFSDDGCLVAVSDTKKTKLYHLQGLASTGPASATRVLMPGSCSPPAHALAFAPDGRRLVIAAAGGDIRIVDLADDAGEMKPSAIRLTHVFDEHVDGVRPGGGETGLVPVTMVKLSANGKWLASASLSGAVYVFDLEGLRHHWALPRFSSEHRTVGMRFHCRDDVLVSVDSSSVFRLLDVRDRRLAAFHENVSLPPVPIGRGTWGGDGGMHALSGLAFNPEDPLHSMLLYNHRSVLYVTPRRKIPFKVLIKAPKSKKPRLDPGGNIGDEADGRISDGISDGNARPQRLFSGSNFRMIRDFSSVVLLDFLGENELLVMENPWECVLESLPHTLERKQYI